MPVDYDVVIVGAGPGGLACAEGLVNRGVRTLLLEKNARIGPKTCAGDLSPLMPPELIPQGAHRIDVQTITLGSRSYRIPFARPHFTCAREALGASQLRRIAAHPDLSVETRAAARVVDAHTVRVNGRSVKTQFIVGADGAGSQVRRFLGLPSAQFLGLTHDVDARRDDLALTIDRRLPGNGYIWSIPHLGHVNAGVYVDTARLHAKAALGLFQAAMAETYPGAKRSRLEGAWIPYRYAGVVHGTVFLVGDAAGLALKTNGEGISTAVISGREVARKIADPAYGMPELARILRIKHKQERLLWLLERSPRSRDALLRAYVTAKRLPLVQRLLTS